MRLVEALGLAPGEVVAFVGAGGKTSALYCLARELLVEGRRVIATTITHMLAPAPEEDWPLVVRASAQDRRDAVSLAVARHGRAFVAAGVEPDGKLVGVDADEVAALAALADVTLVEADGARGRWLKAPAAHEPVIPPVASLVVPVVGLQAIGRPLGPGGVHRPERLAELLGLSIGEPIREEALARLLLHEQGGLRGVPRGARVIPLCNQADVPGCRAAGRRVAAAILGARGPISRVVVGAARAARDDWERWEP